MKLNDLIDILKKQIPKSAEWKSCRGEPYGAYNTKGNPNITKVLYCVTATREIADYAKQQGYQLLISHHPYVVSGIPQLIFHTALDCCEGGLNDMWRDALNVQNPSHFDGTLGWFGPIEPITFEELILKCRSFAGDIIGQEYHDGTDKINSVVICTGLGGMVLDLALSTKADCYILGQNSREASECGFKAVVEVGHTLTEWIGVRLFQKLLEPFGVKVDLAPSKMDHFGGEVHRSFRRFM